jgi:hypothetical protein
MCTGKLCCYFLSKQLRMLEIILFGIVYCFEMKSNAWFIQVTTLFYGMKMLVITIINIPQFFLKKHIL